MNRYEAKVYGDNLGTEVLLQETDEGLELTAYVGDEETTVLLGDGGVRELRLALARYERIAR